MNQMRSADNAPPSPIDSDTTADNPFTNHWPTTSGARRHFRVGVSHRNNAGDRGGNRGFMPKMNLSRFNGKNPSIWKDKCEDYFKLLNIPESTWTTAASLH